MSMVLLSRGYSKTYIYWQVQSILIRICYNFFYFLDSKAYKIRRRKIREKLLHNFYLFLEFWNVIQTLIFFIIAFGCVICWITLFVQIMNICEPFHIQECAFHLSFSSNTKTVNDLTRIGCAIQLLQLF